MMNLHSGLGGSAAQCQLLFALREVSFELTDVEVDHLSTRSQALIVVCRSAKNSVSVIDNTCWESSTGSGKLVGTVRAFQFCAETDRCLCGREGCRKRQSDGDETKRSHVIFGSEVVVECWVGVLGGQRRLGR